ncbi:uncharacterized protein A4U43_C08F30960 [Asparagus officinalis]|nr:uncharacterized protein A4U43_C08F30960 [Asparagus officinalis]
MPSSVPNYRPYYGSMMPYSSQAPPYYSSTPMGNENVQNVGANEFPEFSTQMALGGMSGGHEATPNPEDSTPARRKSPRWTTEQNLAQELYSGGKSVHFNLMTEWLAVRDQPRYGSQVGGNTGSGSSGSKRAHESDASDSNSVGSSARPIGRDAAKKRVKRKARAQPWNRSMKSGQNSNNLRSKSWNDWTK